MEEKCSQCKFWFRDQTLTTLGECHRRSPTIIGKDEKAGVDEFRVWPITAFDDWCGEWKEKE